jgi:hypothetical protein
MSKIKLTYNILMQLLCFCLGITGCAIINNGLDLIISYYNEKLIVLKFSNS